MHSRLLTPLAMACGLMAITACGNSPFGADGGDGGDGGNRGPAEDLVALANFSGNDEGVWGDRSGGADFSNWPDGFPEPSCDRGGEFLRFDDGGSEYAQLDTPFDTTGFYDLALTFVAGYRNSPRADEELDVLSCCGAGCTPASVGSVANATNGGTDECQEYTRALGSAADDCSSLMVRFEFSSGGGRRRAGIDDVVITGEPAQ